jgi:diacylglycerol kinase
MGFWWALNGLLVGFEWAFGGLGFSWAFEWAFEWAFAGLLNGLLQGFWWAFEWDELLWCLPLLVPRLLSAGMQASKRTRVPTC